MTATDNTAGGNLPAITQVFASGRERGLHLGLQLWAAVRGVPVNHAAWGEATPGVPLTVQHWLQWLSAGKPLTAALIARCYDRAELYWDDRVTRFLPNFGVQGKAGITIRHLLTHTAGIRNLDIGWPDCDWHETLERLCAGPLDDGAVPGQTAGYHVASSWFILGAIVERICGQSFETQMQSDLCEPCRLPETRFSPSSREQLELAERLAPLWERTKQGLQQLDWHLPPRVERPSPGSSARGPIRNLGLFYENLRRSLLGDGSGCWQASTIAEMTTRQRVGEFDQTLGHIIDFGLGMIIDSNEYGADTAPYGYGHFCSSQTFGHGGAQSSQGYCDPLHELSVAYVFNGRCGEAQHSRRCRALNDAIYRDLGIAE